MSQASDAAAAPATAPHRRRRGDWLTRARASGAALWSIVPLALVVVALIGSVAVPARQTLRITRLLRETTEVLAPARLLEVELRSGFATELGTLQRFVLLGDSAQLHRFRTTVADDERRLADLERFATRLDVTSAANVAVLRQRIADWRQATRALTVLSEPFPSRAQAAAALRTGRAPYEAAADAFSRLSSDFAAIAAARDDRVEALEHLSIVVNAVLVLAALIAMCGVAALSVRERRLAATLWLRVEEARSRARQESSLREAAEALAGAYTREDVTQRIARAALATLGGSGAFVEQMTTRTDEAAGVTVVRATEGVGVPALETACPGAGSETELVTATGQPMRLTDLASLKPRGVSASPSGGGSAIVVPLGTEGTPMGALFVVRTDGPHFQSDDVARAGIFGHLATLAYEKVRLLEDAEERRRALERVIQSRSRLMRGFSHDVKNPIGAADGFADLLSLGVYGELSAEQRASVDRLRRCLHGALGLIDDLHELARAETGILSLSSAPVDLADLARTLCEEYHAAARAAGLSLSVEVALDLPAVDTDRERVRQIVANLLSNAIKYTPSGSVRVRTTCRTSGSAGEAGDWALVEVIDTGPGIARQQQGVIFEEFSRLGTGERRGAGLGLAISRLLAHALGGHLSVQSEPAHGSTFTLWLPLRGPAPAACASSSTAIDTYLESETARARGA